MDAKTTELIGWLRAQAASKNPTWSRNREAADTIERLARLVECPKESDKQLNRDADGEPALPGQMSLFETSNVAEWVAQHFTKEV